MIHSLEVMAAMKTIAMIFGILCASSFVLAVKAQQTPTDGPRYTNGMNLVKPTDYREWTFLSSGLDLTYPEAGAAERQQQLPPRHSFTNVFVNPSAYRSFLQTGKWPDRTIFILEARRADAVSKYFPANQTGQYQTGFSGLEANVKDARFPDGWGFFRFDDAASAAPLTGEALSRGQCVECHTKETAVERTFVQFYPTLFEVARQKGTVKPGF